ncbi:transporter substrate-binding domain-containing protein [Alisedimentitalea sp. MJ-SS2]|uniref:transporter substrate-binding domain-containing protein n=1 Tax=Aliisedimentitalea sp. MJ-SS2 TaxID=3049795 RepID=UPI00290E2EDA|nr:transporter substrate-binding domain-containing protein [Alisedimentitalea sp. MJ-SS2]MDU8926375.1 transporter substrate-binding domain-containing protein [Alisedimentitalea sp. MJ-SS2]
MRTLILIAMLGFAQVAQADGLRIGTEGAQPPYNFVENGEVRGFEREMGDMVCARMKLDCTWQVVAPDALLPGLAEARYDVVISAVPTDAALGESLAQTQPYVMPDIVASIHLAGKKFEMGSGRMVAIPGFDVETWSKLSGRNAEMFESSDAALQALRDGEVDLVVGPRAVLAPVVAEADGMFDYMYEAQSYAPGYAAVFREDDVDRRFAFEDMLFDMSKDGSLRELVFKWFGHGANPG